MDEKTIALVLVMALRSGASIRNILEEAHATGDVPEDTWDQVRAEIAAANDAWENE